MQVPRGGRLFKSDGVRLHEFNAVFLLDSMISRGMEIHQARLYRPHRERGVAGNSARWTHLEPRTVKPSGTISETRRCRRKDQTGPREIFLDAVNAGS